MLDNGICFEESKIPEYGKMVDMVKKLHCYLAKFRLVAWDITVDENGQVRIIEYNLRYPGCSRYQECNGPFFGDITDDVLKMIFSEK